MVFWNNEPNANLAKMFDKYFYEEPEDIQSHIETVNKKMEDFDFKVAVASKGLGSDSVFKQIFNGVRFLIKYRKDQERASTRSKFFMTVLKEKTVLRMMKFAELDIVKSQLK